MLEITRKLLLASVGAVELTKEKVEGIIQELIKKGEVAKEEGMGLIEEILRRKEESKKALENKIETEITKVMEKLNIPTKKEIQKLREKIEILTKNIDKITKDKAH